MVQTIQAFLKRLLTTVVAALMVVFSFGVGEGLAQQTIFLETLDINESRTGTLAIDAVDLDNPGLSFTGTGDSRTTNSSSGYDGASGNRNIFLTNTGNTTLVISNINTSEFEDINLEFGLRKHTTASDATHLIVEVSDDGENFSTLTFPEQSTGSGTTNWRLIEITGGTIPSASDVTIRFTNEEGEAQINLDDIKLTGTPSTENPLIVRSPSSLSGFSYVNGSGPSDEQNFTVEGLNLEDDITVSPPTNFEISETSGSGFTTGNIILTEANSSVAETTIYVRLEADLSHGLYGDEIVITSPNTNPTTVSLSGEVIEPFAIPYINDFRTTDDFDFAVAQGFSIVDADLQTGTGGYLRINRNGYAETPTIDFTQFEYLHTKFDIEPWGSGSDRELSVLLSNNDGASFDTIVTYYVPEDYQTFTTLLDLSDEYDVENGKIQYKMTDGTGRTRFRDLEIIDAEKYETQISEAGGEGWRMLSLPVGDVAVRSLAGQNLVQGVTGGNDFYDDGKDYDDAATNLYYYLDSTGDTWQEFDNFNSNISSGQGFIWYMFDNDDFNSVSLPFTLSAFGASPSADVTIPLNQEDDFTLIGNPFTVNLDASDVSSWGDLNATARAWDPNANQYVDVENATPFTGFFVESAVGGTGDITIPVSASSSKQIDSEHHRIALNLLSENENNLVIQDNSTSILFRQGATHEWDIYDATKLVPLLSSYATVGIVGDRAGEERIKSIDSRPIDFSGELELALALNVYNFGGEFQLSADLIDVPEEWSLFLNDYETGETVDLRQTAYTFNYNNSSQKIVEAEHKMPETFVMSSEEADERFTLIIEAGEAVSIPDPDELPQKLNLSQNYPNPFNPVTVINFDIPRQSHVRLAVYDLLGRQVDVLVNDTRERGSYDVTWDASRFSSGVYFYHLEADGQSLTRRMTLIK